MTTAICLMFRLLIPDACPVPEDLPILPSWYNPSLGGTNCDEDCYHLADGGTWNEGDYGHVAACIDEWSMLPGYQPTVVLGCVGSVLCRDAGGAVHVNWNEDWGWYIPLDILDSGPSVCTGSLIYDWEIVWP